MNKSVRAPTAVDLQRHGWLVTYNGDTFDANQVVAVEGEWDAWSARASALVQGGHRVFLEESEVGKGADTETAMRLMVLQWTGAVAQARQDAEQQWDAL